MRRLAPDVQRDLPFYRLAVEFRDGVERMLERRGRLSDPEHVWHGFDTSGGHGRDDRWRADDDGLAGSRVPRQPPDGAGTARIELEPVGGDSSSAVA